MDRPCRAVFLMDSAPSGTEHFRPLMLEAVFSRPILYWMGCQSMADGVQRFFVVSPASFETEIRACFPADTDVVVSEQHSDLMAFLDTDESVLVLNRPALPFREAGAGFAYAAPGRALRETWKVRLTNAVQEAILCPGWVPVFNAETLAELGPVFEAHRREMDKQGL